MSTAIIFGGGIGGLTAGLALAAKGWDVQVVERAPELRPVGAALLVAPNALRALDTLPDNIVDELQGLAAIQGDGGLKAANGSWLSRNDAGLALERYGYPAIAVLRSALVEMLASRLPVGALRLGSPVTAVDAAAGSVTLATGEVLEADLVVAADGLRSLARSTLFPEHPVPAFLGLTGWQTTVPGEGLAPHVGTTWGPSGEFGAIPLADGSLYLFAAHATEKRMALRSGAEEKAELLRLYGGYHEPIPTLIRRIDPDHLLHNDIYAVRTPLPAMYRGRIAMLGDAAHAMSPNLGQGACQAIEDAVTLAYCVAERGVPEGLAAYSAARLPRTSMLVSRSEQVGRIATASNPIMVALRNTLVRALGLLGSSAALRQADFVMKWDHPAVRPAATLTTG